LNHLPDQKRSPIRRVFDSWTHLFPSPGLLSHAALFVVIGSGIALAFVYDVTNPFDSLQVMILGNAGGTFLRGVHFWSAQLFLILAAIHFAEQLAKEREREVPLGFWFRFSLLLPLVLFLMISGFILKGDRGGILARQVAEGLLSTLPLVGDTVKFLLFGSARTLELLYVHHIATTTLLVLFFTLEHGRRIWPEWRSLIYVLTFSMLLSALRTPVLNPEGTGVHVKGPWYFVGFQEMLHWSARPGWILGLGGGLFLALCALPVLPGSVSKALKRLMIAVLLAYGGVSVMNWFFRGTDWQWVVPWGAP
jgi:quinol-cytochrome oxidoreductase complex cytochrome b subunit